MLITPGMYVKRVSPYMVDSPFPYGHVARVVEVGELGISLSGIWVRIDWRGSHGDTWSCAPGSVEEAMEDDVLRYLLAGRGQDR